MEKEMYELEKKNAELQRHHAEDSISATPQPDGGEERDEEIKAPKAQDVEKGG
jgi:hypothetical protein